MTEICLKRPIWTSKKGFLQKSVILTEMVLAANFQHLQNRIRQKFKNSRISPSKLIPFRTEICLYILSECSNNAIRQKSIFLTEIYVIANLRHYKIIIRQISIEWLLGKLSTNESDRNLSKRQKSISSRTLKIINP